MAKVSRKAAHQSKQNVDEQLAAAAIYLNIFNSATSPTGCIQGILRAKNGQNQPNAFSKLSS